MKRCLCVPVPARVTSKDAEADGPSCMCIRHRLQSQVASKFVCWGLALVYKPSPPFRNSVTHSHSTALEDFFFKERKKERKINCPRMSLPLFVLTVLCACIIISHSHSKSEGYVAFVHAKAGQKSIQNRSSIVVVLCHVLHNFPFQIARPQLWNVLFNQLATQFTIKATVVHGREFLRYWNKKSLELYSLQIILNCDFYYRSNTRITGVIKMY